MNAEDGSDTFRWVRALEKGASGRNTHFHALVGGFRNRPQFWAKRWEHRGGEALIEPYDSTRQGLLYLLKGMNEEGNIDIEFKLPSPSTSNAVDGVERKRRV